MNKNKKANIICAVIGLIITVPIVLILAFTAIKNSLPKNENMNQPEETTNAITDNLISDETPKIEHTVPIINKDTEITTSVPTEKPDIDVSEITRDPNPEVVYIEVEYGQKEINEDE